MPISSRSATTGAAKPDAGGKVSAVRRAWDYLVPRLTKLRSGTWALTRQTVQSAFQYRVTGLAAEIGFFSLLSLPPLVLGLIGTLGYFRSLLGPITIGEIRNRVLDSSHAVLTNNVVDTVVRPLLDTVLAGGRGDIVSISFVVSLWSGSRALNVCVDTITIAYGLNGIRGIVRTRALSFTLYVLGLVGGLVAIPPLLAGPNLVQRLLPIPSVVIEIFYWPTLGLITVALLTGLYSAAVPVRTPWYRDMPGALLALVIWVIGSAGLRIYLEVSLSGVSIYGSLAAPIAMLAWLYVTAFAVLIGALLNASIDQLWPSEATREEREARKHATEPIRIGATKLRSHR